MVSLVVVVVGVVDVVVGGGGVVVAVNVAAVVSRSFWKQLSTFLASVLEPLSRMKAGITRKGPSS